MQRTISVKDSNRKAQLIDRLREFEVLAAFAKTGDLLEDYRSLAAQWPSFWPVNIRDSRGRPLAWLPEHHRVFLIYRDLLRRVWQSSPQPLQWNIAFVYEHPKLQEEFLAGKTPAAGRTLREMLGPRDPQSFMEEPLRFLLGLSGEDWNKDLELWHWLLGYGEPNIFPPPETVELRDQQTGESSTAEQPPPAPAAPPTLRLDWRRGDITYFPTNTFQRALYSLFRESWRAMVCPECRKYFVAEKTAQKYCSTRCSAERKRKKSLEEWRRKGSAKRDAKRRKDKKARKAKGGK